VISEITPTAVTFTQFLFLVRVGHSESQVGWVQVFIGVLQHLLHFGDHCGGLTVRLFMVDSTADSKD
jgi:hypothetical protein